MGSKMVLVDNHPITKIDGYFLFEVDDSMIVPVVRTVGMQDLLGCKTLDDVRRLVAPLGVVYPVGSFVTCEVDNWIFSGTVIAHTRDLVVVEEQDSGRRVRRIRSQDIVKVEK
jgi:hypothetical protein